MPEDTKEVSFVTKKALVTFSHHVAVWVNKTVIVTDVCFIEFIETENENKFWDFSKEVKIIKFGNGPKLEKSINVKLGSFGGIFAMVILDDNEEI